MEAASKAIEDFQISEDYEDEKVKYSADAYDVGKQSIWDKVVIKHLKLDLNFLDKI